MATPSDSSRPDAEVYTLTEAAERLRVSMPTAYRWARTGRFPPKVGARVVKVGVEYRVSRPELDEFLSPAS
jgi:excisionase family DNA binding protein